MSTPKNLTFISALLLAIGAFMPWAVITSLFLGISRSISGVETDGIFSGVGGFILLLVAFGIKGTPGKSYSLFGFIISLLCFLLLISKIFSVNQLAAQGNDVVINIGAGLYLSILGSMLGMFASLTKTPTAGTPITVAEDIPATEDIPTKPKLQKNNDKTD
jgi:hypothetical protein